MPNFFEIAERQRNFEQKARDYLNETSWKTSPTPLKEAIFYSLFAGKSKRLRPLLLEEQSRLCGLNEKSMFYMALAIECIHAYSLVHDDLPALDNDPLRRGEPSCHIRFGEAMAILAGDGLQSLAYECLSYASLNAPALELFSRSIGPAGMVGGQALDIESTKELSPALLREIHTKKTGCLFALSSALPYVQTNQESSWAYRLGLYMGKLYQVVDDYLDATATEEKAGKKTGKDQDKLTYIRLYGLDKTKKMIYRQKERLLRYQKKYFPHSPFLELFINYLTSSIS
ncbi:MAG: polyprenyl synthetase family protein [Leptospiraceae bacterium]|nr:polyprenyl synthetase family protein [Leptospiraceae bacterium]MDW8307101.1 polyprenyl synthetase family protein [Leptospiraceae bacterium]